MAMTKQAGGCAGECVQQSWERCTVLRLGRSCGTMPAYKHVRFRLLVLRACGGGACPARTAHRITRIGLRMYASCTANR
eukprot:3990376-Alexandrium_andersonii.AAC.1